MSMRSVVICGSRRFEPEIRKFEQELRDVGVVVFEPHLHKGEEEWERLSEKYKDFTLLALTLDHFRKIAQADVVFVFNQDGYIGPSTTLEIGCAAGLNKTIYALAPDSTERARNVLFKEFISTAEELLPLL